MTAHTLAEIVLSRRGDDAIGLRFEEESWTWGEVVSAGAQRAQLLRETTARPTDRQIHVGILAANVPDFVFWTAACALQGAVLVGLNTSRSSAEIAADLAHADVDVVVVESSLTHLLQGAGVPESRTLVIDSARYRALLDEHADAALPDVVPSPEDIALLLFSSGSTGTPKAVVVGQGRIARLTPLLAERIDLDRHSVTYLCMPLFHGNAMMMNLCTALLTGASVGMTRTFSASRFSADVHRFGATFTNYVGRALSYVLTTPVDPRDADSTLKLAFGTEASEADAARFSARFGAEVREGYGMSEGVIRINRTADTPTGSLGLPPEALDVRILDESTGAECPRAVLDEHGRISNPEAVGQFVAVGGAAAFEGYWKNPAATSDRVRGNDFWSGDLGYRDTDGWFWFAGRSSDWLRVDSENFAAAQVERILHRFEPIASAPVYAVPDPVTGDRVMCAIELAPGASFDPQAFGDFLSAQPDLGAKWWPHFVRVVAAVPLTASNKVDKAPLRSRGWVVEDPVFVRRDRTEQYVPWQPADSDRLAAEFAQHGRSALLPGPV